MLCVFVVVVVFVFFFSSRRRHTRSVSAFLLNRSSDLTSLHLEIPAEFQSQLVKLWEGYLSLQQALSGDDLSLVQQAVTHFQTSLSSVDAKPLAEDAHQVWMKEYSNLIQILQGLNQSEDLKSVRGNFSLLSDRKSVV